MKFINKNSSPIAYDKYCKRKDAAYSDLQNNNVIKKVLKKSLLKEQGYICCYCGCKITEDNMIIEHLLPRSRYPNIELDYNNLLASCDGGRKKRTENNKINTQKNNIIPECCDSAKKNNEIKITPLMPKCEESFLFDDEGKIYPMPGNTDAKDTINVLSLNAPSLNHKRKAAIEAYKYIVDENNCQVFLEDIEKCNANFEYEPFCFVIKFYIEKFIK